MITLVKIQTTPTELSNFILGAPLNKIEDGKDVASTIKVKRIIPFLNRVYILLDNGDRIVFKGFPYSYIIGELKEHEDKKN